MNYSHIFLVLLPGKSINYIICIYSLNKVILVEIKEVFRVFMFLNVQFVYIFLVLYEKIFQIMYY